jgi:hypothetical protein
MRRLSAVLIVLSLLHQPALAESDEEMVAFASDALIFGDDEEAAAAVSYLAERGQADAAAAAILALRYGPVRRAELVALLEGLTGHQVSNWHDWMIWQELHPEIVPHPSFRDLAIKVLQQIDPRFPSFFEGELRIRLEEIAWGGVPALDGIPSLDRPAMTAASEASYLLDDDLVFGIAIGDDARAYPLRILGWHEMMNDVVGGVPLALAYCTLCGAGILYETQVAERDEPLIFGSSGLLYRSNKLMFDWETKSLWNQFTGEPISGPLATSGLVLRRRPIAVTSWAAWRERHPKTTVLSLETGHARDYGSGVVYGDYFASPALMFPAAQEDDRLAAKDYVFGLRVAAAAKAWPLAAFAQGRVIDDQVGHQPVVLIGWESRREVLAYDRGTHRFAAHSTPGALVDETGAAWSLTDEALLGGEGERLPRLAGHVAYWFAWDSFVAVPSELYQAP